MHPIAKTPCTVLCGCQDKDCANNRWLLDIDIDFDWWDWFGGDDDNAAGDNNDGDNNDMN